ncbi:MAG: hypothetical protein K6D38_04005 [Pseudobutyrivibrio sp.]|nr:hypothetical protein [Pseudobutyrivibrio sp.]
MKRKPYSSLLAISLCFVTTMFTGCTAPLSPDDVQENVEAVTTAQDTTTDTTAAESETDTTSTENDDATSSDVCGKYVYTYTDEIGDNEVSAEYGYIFNEDHTGLAIVQDYLMFTWDDKQIHMNGKSLDYEIKGDVLTFKGSDDGQEYTKKKETDPVLNGDFSEYAGFYKPTDKSNSDFGNGDKIVDVEIHEDGSITGGHPVDGNTLIKQVAPSFILEEPSGGYTCLFTDKDSVEDFNQGKYLSYTIYPADSVPEYLSKESNNAKETHISLRQIDDDVYTPNFYFEGKEVQ